MNEEQRIASQQVNQPKTKNEPEKDYSKYFEKVFTAPSLKDAKKRGKEEISTIKILISLKNLQEWAKDALFIFVHMAAK